MRIDPKVEKAGREMLGHAIRGELQELATLIQSVGEDAYRQCLALFVLAAGYLAIDVSKGWPTEADIREIARNAADAEKNFELGESDFYDYLSRSALGFEPLDQALGTVDAAAALPVLLTGSLLLTFHPRGQKWWDYLDAIESAFEAADRVDSSVLPAMMLLARREEQREGN